MAAKFDNNKLALTLSGRAKKKTWTKAEDAQLAQLVEVHGTTNWTLIAEHLPRRTGKQCRERYNNHLQPDVNKGEWTEEEDAILERLHEALGNQWSKMTRELPGRTDNAIKNRWHSTHRCFNEASAVTVSPPRVSVGGAGSLALAPAAIPSVSAFTFSSVALASTHSFYHEYHDHEVASVASSPASSPSKTNILAQQQHHVFPSSSSKSTFLSAAASVDQDDCSEGATSEDSRTTAASSLSEELEMFPGNMEGFELVVQGHAISTSNFRLFMDLDSLDCSPATEVDDAFFPDDDVDYESQGNELGGDLEELFACWEASNDVPDVPKLGSSLHKLGGCGMGRSFRDSWGSLSPCARSPNKSRISTPVAAKKCRWQ